MNIQISLSHFKILIDIVSTMRLFQQIKKIFKANYSSNFSSNFFARFRVDQYNLGRKIFYINIY